MSSRARRAVSPAVAAYDWDASSNAGGPAAAGEPSPMPPDLDARSAAAIDEQLKVEQQARLAALEREAFATGYAQGERAGLEAGNTRAEAMLRRLAQTLDELRGLRATMIRQTERQMVDLALAVARRILRREASVDQDLIVAMARVALERLGESGSTTIRLNPEDYAQTVQRQADHWAGAKVTVVADPAVSRGGCMVESDFGFIDAGVEAQFEQIAQALTGQDGEVTDARATAA